ncbi:MAG: hypothetical protein R3E79_14715 [Caldilineaceae bacterium]
MTNDDSQLLIGWCICVVIFGLASEYSRVRAANHAFFATFIGVQYPDLAGQSGGNWGMVWRKFGSKNATTLTMKIVA